MFSTELFAAFLLFFIIISHLDVTAGDINTNCKTKIRNMWLKYCVNDGVRLKRDVFQVESRSHPRDLEILHGNIRGSRDEGTTESRDEEYKEKTWERNYPAEFGFPPPLSGDDLSMGMKLTDDDLEGLLEEMIERLPRAAKNKDQTMRMITAYAASCCNENLNDANCSDPMNVINCP